MKHIIGERWQHCGCAAQQDRKQIERDAAEQEAFPPDEFGAISHQFQRRLFCGGGRGTVADRQQCRNCQHQHCRRIPIGQRRVCSEEKSARSRTDHCGRLPCDRTGRDRFGQQFRRDHVGGDRADRRADENTCRAVTGGEAEQQRQRHEVPGVRGGQRQPNQQIDGGSNRTEMAAVHAVGQYARNRGQQHERNELDQPQHAEQERGLFGTHAIISPGDLIDLRADHHDHGGGRRGRDEPCQPDQAIVTDLKGMGRRAHAPAMAAPPALAKRSDAWWP